MTWSMREWTLLRLGVRGVVLSGKRRQRLSGRERFVGGEGLRRRLEVCERR